MIEVTARPREEPAPPRQIRKQQPPREVVGIDAARLLELEDGVVDAPPSPSMPASSSRAPASSGLLRTASSRVRSAGTRRPSRR